MRAWRLNSAGGGKTRCSRRTESMVDCGWLSLMRAPSGRVRAGRVVARPGTCKQRPRLLSQEGAKASLDEVQVRGEGVADGPIAHDDEGDAVGEAPVLVRPLAVQVEG